MEIIIGNYFNHGSEIVKEVGTVLLFFKLRLVTYKMANAMHII